MKIGQGRAHAIDPKSAEFNGAAFEATFIYGLYDGRLIFLAPMVSESYLKSRPDVMAAISVPEEYSIQAYYPTDYAVKYIQDSKEYVVSGKILISKNDY